jgi:hypothetical protein
MVDRAWIKGLMRPKKFRQRMNCVNVGCKNGGNFDAAQGGGGSAIADLFDF